MPTHRPLILAGIACAFLSVSVALAADYTPPSVAPIDSGDARYIANQPAPGEVTAWTISDGKRVWEKKLYDTTQVDKPTADNHPNYLAKMELKDGALQLADEKGASYTISVTDPAKPEVKSSLLNRLQPKSKLIAGILAGVVVVVFLLVILLIRRQVLKRRA